jgi:hypothetical protein
MTFWSDRYDDLLSTVSRKERPISGKPLRAVTFVGIVYWNWKFIENDSIFFGKSTGKPIPILNWKTEKRTCTMSQPSVLTFSR